MIRAYVFLYRSCVDRSFSCCGRESLGPYPEAAWYEHPTAPAVDLSSTVEDYEVHPIYSVNVPLDYDQYALFSDTTTLGE